VKLQGIIAFGRTILPDSFAPAYLFRDLMNVTLHVNEDENELITASW
jgi:hypothetical protein